LRVLESSISAYQAAPIWQDFIIEGIVGIEVYKAFAVMVYPKASDAATSRSRENVMGKFGTAIPRWQKRHNEIYFLKFFKLNQDKIVSLHD